MKRADLAIGVGEVPVCGIVEGEMVGGVVEGVRGRLRRLRKDGTV